MSHGCFKQNCEFEVQYICLCLCSETFCCEFHLREHLKLKNNVHSFDSIFEEPKEWTKAAILKFLANEKFKKERLKTIALASFTQNCHRRDIEDSLTEVDSDIKEVNFLIQNISQFSDKELVSNRSILAQKEGKMWLTDSEPFTSVRVFCKLRELRNKRYKILNKDKMDRGTEQDFRKVCSLYQNYIFHLKLSQAYEKYVNAYQKITSLYLIKDEHLFVYGTENEREEVKVLKMRQKQPDIMIQLPNGELFLIFNKEYLCAFIIDRDYQFRELPPGLPEDCLTAVYFNRSVYCFGIHYGYIWVFKKFNLDENWWSSLAQIETYENFYGNSIVFNGNIFIPKKSMNILLYSIDINSFSKIYFEFFDYESERACSSDSSPSEHSWENDNEYDKLKFLTNTEERMYLIKHSRRIYESEIENCYVWELIADASTLTPYWREIYCSYNKEKLFLAANYDTYLRKYFYFDLDTKDFINYKSFNDDPRLEPDVNLYNYGIMLTLNGKYLEAIENYSKAITLNPENANYYLKKGKSLNQLDRFLEAIDCFNEVIKLNTKIEKGYREKAFALKKLERRDEEIECYNELIKLDPKDWDAYKYKANALYDLERYLELAEWCNEWIKHKQNCNDDAFKMKACALHNLGRNIEEIEIYSELIKFNPENSCYYIWKGDALHSLGKNLEAVECYNEAIKIDFINAKDYTTTKNAVLQELGRNLKDIKFYDEIIKLSPEDALECYNEAIELDPEYSFAYLLKGNALRRLGKNIEAVECYDELIRLKPKDWKAHLNKGVALNNLDKNLEAIESYNLSIKLKPSNIKAYIKKANSLIKLGSSLEAIEYLNWAIKLDPKNWKAYYAKSIAMDQLGKNFESIECYNEIIKLRPRDQYSYYMKGCTLFNMGRHLEAIECFNDLIKLEPENITAYNEKGYTLHCLGRHLEAIECFNEAIKLDPQNLLLKTNKGNVLCDLGRYDEAISCYDECGTLHPEVCLKKAHALRESGRYNEAIESYDEFSELCPEEFVVYLSKGDVLQSLGKNLEAIECYRKIIKLNPNDSYCYFRIANALHNMDRNLEAIKYYNKAIALDHTDSIYFCYRAILLNSLGQDAEAMQDFDRAYNLMSASSDSWYIDSSLISDCLELLKMISKLLESVAKAKREIKNLKNLNLKNQEVLQETEEKEEKLNEQNSQLLKRAVKCLDPRNNIAIKEIQQIKRELDKYQGEIIDKYF